MLLKQLYKRIGHIKQYLLVPAFVFASASCYAAFSFDSTFISFTKRPKFFFQFDASNTFDSRIGANAGGIKAGLDFGKRIKFGAGFYHVMSDIVENKYISKYNDHYNTRVDMNYYTTFVDYVLYNQSRWQFSFLNQFGIGNAYLFYYPDKTDEKGKPETTSNRTVILYEPMAMGQFKIMKWFGIEFGTGYRMMLLRNKEIDHRLSSPIYTIRLKLFLDEIYKTIFPEGIIQKKK